MPELLCNQRISLQRRPIRRYAPMLALGALCASCQNPTVKLLPNISALNALAITRTEADARNVSGDKAQATTANPLAGCTMCHTDIEEEFVGSAHFNKNVGCVKCHGPSEGHVADENNEVKPDELFAREDVDRLCGVCHGCSRPTEAEMSRPALRKVCTDCHGSHNLALLNGGR